MFDIMIPARPEIFCDLNAHMTENGYLLTDGSVRDLAMLGLTVEQAAGMLFTFNCGGDGDDNGELSDLLFDGTIQEVPGWGYLAIIDTKGVYRRPRK